jgi:hypothetical protein
MSAPAQRVIQLRLSALHQGAAGIPQATDCVVAAGARGRGYAKSDASSAIVLDKFNAGSFERMV